MQPHSTTERLPISSIIVGARYRKSMGDIDALARSIAEVGLLHPVAITIDNQLIAGCRRLEACKSLGWSDIPVHVVDLVEIVRGEFHENVVRKDFQPSEMVEIKRAVEPAEQAAAKERMAEGGRIHTTAEGKESFLTLNAGQSRDKVASYVGVSSRTLEKAEAVVAAAEREPDRYVRLVEQMDRTGKVDGAYRKLRQFEDEVKTLAVTPVAGKFRTIVIDPPWDYEGLSLAGRGQPEYAVMSHGELLALPVAEWAEPDCHLYLWTTNNFLTRAVELVSAWGFAYKTILTWVKPSIGLGSYFRNSTEQCLFAVVGNMTTRVKDIPTHFLADRCAHSTKPDCFFDLVERASYPPYIEAFSRQQRPSWTTWGTGM